jgi:hypothetical protein
MNSSSLSTRDNFGICQQKSLELAVFIQPRSESFWNLPTKPLKLIDDKTKTKKRFFANFLTRRKTEQQ